MRTANLKKLTKRLIERTRHGGWLLVDTPPEDPPIVTNGRIALRVEDASPWGDIPTFEVHFYADFPMNGQIENSIPITRTPIISDERSLARLYVTDHGKAVFVPETSLEILQNPDSLVLVLDAATGPALVVVDDAKDPAVWMKTGESPIVSAILKGRFPEGAR